MKHSDCTISIITATAFEQVQRTLSTVLASREGARLILTANGNPEAAEYFNTIARQRDSVSVIVNSANAGFIAPSNEAFNRCETPFFIALNDDAIPPHDWIDLLKKAVLPEGTVIAGPGQRWLDDNFIGHQWRGGIPMDAEYIEASCMIVKTEALRANSEPLFWKDLQFGYCEDADLSLRMRSHGYEIAHSPFVLQHKSGTTTRTVPELHDIMRGNFALCRERWGDYLKTRKFQ